MDDYPIKLVEILILYLIFNLFILLIFSLKYKITNINELLKFNMFANFILFMVIKSLETNNQYLRLIYNIKLLNCR